MLTSESPLNIFVNILALTLSCFSKDSEQKICSWRGLGGGGGFVNSALMCLNVEVQGNDLDEIQTHSRVGTVSVEEKGL